MKTWFVTFGQELARREHARFPAAHPDGFVVVEASDEAAARETAHEHLGRDWAFLYSEDSPHRPDMLLRPGTREPLYPRGELARFHARQVEHDG